MQLEERPLDTLLVSAQSYQNLKPKNQVSEVQLEERQESVRARDGQFSSLASRGKEQVQFLSNSFLAPL